MIVWAGQGLTSRGGGRYYPAGNTWVAVCDQNAPDGRENASAVWTGTEMIAWGGNGGTPVSPWVNTGGRYTVQPLPTPALLLEEAGPVPNQAAALDSLLLIRDPFPVVNANALYQGADRNTRVVVFVSNLHLLPGEPSSSVIVHLVDSNNQNYDLAAADVRPAANFTQVTFRLPNNLAVGTCTVTLTYHAQVSNAGTIKNKNLELLQEHARKSRIGRERGRPSGFQNLRNRWNLRIRIRRLQTLQILQQCLLIRSEKPVP